MDLKSGLDVGFNDGVKTSEGIIAGDIEILLLVDVVLVVFLADRVDSGENVDHGHLLFLANRSKNVGKGKELLERGFRVRPPAHAQRFQIHIEDTACMQRCFPLLYFPFGTLTPIFFPLFFFFLFQI